MQQLYGLQQTAAPAAEPVSLADAKLYGRVSTTADDSLIYQLIAAARRHAEEYCNRAFVTQSWLLTLDRFPGIVGTTPTVYTAYRDWPIFWDLIRFPKSPLISVDSVNYVDTAGNTDLIDPSIYQADTNTEPGRLRPAYGKIWPVPRAQLASVQIGFTCGYGPVTTIALAISAGAGQVVTPASMAGISVGQLLTVISDSGANREQVKVTAVTGTTFTATFAMAHGAGATINNVPDGIQLAIKTLVNFWYENRQAAGGGPDTWPLAVRSLLDDFWTGTYLTGVGSGDR